MRSLFLMRRVRLRKSYAEPLDRRRVVEHWAVQSGRVIDERHSMYGHVREIGLFNWLSKTPGLAKGSAPRLGRA